MKNILLHTKLLLLALITGGSVYAGGPTAYVQLIHNCADPAAAAVSVYADFGAGQSLVSSSFAFRTASSFLPIPAGVAATVYIKAPNASISDPAIYSQTLPALAADSSYVVIASGVVGSGFATNPNSVSTAFGLKILAPARRASFNAGKVEFAVFHGSTDAPAVDVNITGGATLVPNAKYGDASGYLSVDPTWYPIDIAPAGVSTPVASYVADLTGLGGGSAVVFASGFLTPSTNNNGAAFGLFAALADGTVVELPLQDFAKVQVLHNCADPAASSVDVYIDGALALDNFAFRTGTPFIDLLAGVNHTIAVAPSTSASVAEALASFPNINLAANENYIVAASGVVGSGFAANPNSVSTAFTLKVIADARTQAANAAKVDFAVLHGATDAPAVDVNISGGATLVPNAKYLDATGYLSVDPTWYPIDIAPAGVATPVASYVADLTALTGGSALVFASGFLTPSANNNGPAFGIYALLANGTVVALPIQQFANVQVLHNCADPIADSVDVYVNGALAIDNFAFRTGTSFFELIAGYPNSVAIAPKTSTTVGDAIWTRDYTLTAGTNYILTASGVVGSGFAANPDGNSTAFDVLVKASAQTAALVNTNFDFYAIHGATDAPAVDVVANGALTVVNNAYYGDQTGYIPVPASSYTLSVKDSTGATTLVSYSADVTSLAGKSAVVLASGFLTPSANNNGAAFGLYVALPEGGPFIALPVFTSIQNEGAPAIEGIYPNPSQGILNVTIGSDMAQVVGLRVTDISGREVKAMNSEVSARAGQTVTMDLSDVSNGLYLLHATSAGKTTTQKFNLVK
ncbi:MAG TPA: DUF4397 domain-containing protein [Chitinophagales bacterium]|nr:DUF4397 domain-containing protein [Chitinophagales bacterium]